MTRILFVLPRFHTNLWFAARAMTGAGHAVGMLTIGAGWSEDHTHVAPIVMGRSPDPHAVAQAVTDFRPDIVIVRHAPGLSKPAAQAARRLGVPLLGYDLRPMTDRPGPLKRLERRWQGRPARRVTPVRGLDPDAPRDPDARYLPWPVAALPHDALPPRDDGRLRLLCVGKMGSSRKNQPLLIDAIEASGLDEVVHLTLVGTDPGKAGRDHDHARRIRQAAARGWVTLADPVPFARMAGYYAAADACILPSTDEPLGVAPVEAMAYGAVPLISDQAGSAGYLTHGTDGFVIDPTRPETLAYALRGLAGDRARLAAMRDAARTTAATALSETAFLARLDAILREAGAA